MHTLMLVRHAEADHANNDHLRPLTARGRRQATAMGQWCAAHELRCDRLIASSAARCQQTAEYLAQAAAWPAPVSASRLYEAPIDAYLAVLASVSDLGAVALVGHNPTLTALIHHLAGDAVPAGLYGVPPGTIVQLALQQPITLEHNGMGEIVDYFNA